MSDDEADAELLALLRESLGLGPASSSAPPDTGVLKSAEYVYDNAVDVSISSQHTKAAAETIWKMMQDRNYSTLTWSEHELHPKTKDESTVNFIFTMNLLNFCFWSELSDEERFTVEYKGRKWTGYWSLVAALQRALDEVTSWAIDQKLTGHPITSPSFYASPDQCPDSTLTHIFRSCTSEPIPLLTQRISILRSAGAVLTDPTTFPLTLIHTANKSASGLVNLLTQHIDSLNDTATFHAKQIRFHKRAQILVADLWAAFNGTSHGEFHDIDTLTMFADYRVPQMLHMLGCLWYSPRLQGRIKRKEEIQSGDRLEIEIRGCSIWCVELIRREMGRRFGGEVEIEVVGAEGEKVKKKTKVNAVLIDYLLYDVSKEKEREGGGEGGVLEEGEKGMRLPHHRTRSIWY